MAFQGYNILSLDGVLCSFAFLIHFVANTGSFNYFHHHPVMLSLFVTSELSHPQQHSARTSDTGCHDN